jgi:hypothetical protein
MTGQPIPLHAPKHAWFGQDPLENVGVTELFDGTAQSVIGFGGADLQWFFAHGPDPAGSVLLDVVSDPALPSVKSYGTYGIAVYTWAANATWDANGYWQLVFSVLTNVGFWFPSLDGVPTAILPGHAIPIVTSAQAVMEKDATIKLTASNRDSNTKDFQLTQALVTKISG